VYFYELHESDEDLFDDALLVHELEFDEDEFLELVLEARERVLGTFKEDTLVEAVARELERTRGFVYVGDERLRASVRLSPEEGATAPTRVEEARVDRSGEPGVRFGVADDSDYRSLLVERDPEDER
jgi:hypothetical protein